MKITILMFNWRKRKLRIISRCRADSSKSSIIINYVMEDNLSSLLDNYKDSKTNNFCQTSSWNIQELLNCKIDRERCTNDESSCLLDTFSIHMISTRVVLKSEEIAESSTSIYFTSIIYHDRIWWRSWSYERNEYMSFTKLKRRLRLAVSQYKYIHSIRYFPSSVDANSICPGTLLPTQYFHTNSIPTIPCQLIISESDFVVKRKRQNLRFTHLI